MVLSVLLSMIGLSAIGVGSHVLAQPSGQTLRQGSGQIWSDPVNLSHSGAASEPVVAASPDGTLQVFWWDQLDGLTTAHWDGEAWGAAVASPIYVVEEVEGKLTPVPIETMPLLTPDAGGWVHAFWLGKPDEKTGARSLMHSQLAIGDTAWSTPDVVAPSALICYLKADFAGTLHLAYVRPQHSDASPAGVYYTRSTDGGRRWSAPQVLYRSMYFRLLSLEEAQLYIASDGEGEVYVTWDDPRLETVFYVRSIDDGLTWGESHAVGNLEEGAKRAYVVYRQEGDPLLLWQAIQATGSCALYQQRANDGGETQRVLEELGKCPETIKFLHTANGQVLLVMSSGGGDLTLVAWDDAADRWSEPKWLSLSFEDPVLERRVYLGSLNATLAGDALAMVGQGQDGDVWFLESQVSALEWAYAPPSPWSEPVDLSSDDGLPGLPTLATDADGQVHVLWSEAIGEDVLGKGLYYAGYNGTRWTQPVEVLRSSEGKAEQPALVAVGNRLHALWSGGRSGKIFYSRAYIQDAYTPGGWSEPQSLPAPGDVGSSPAIVADLVGTLHAVYAVELNEGRGIYYTRSDDGGETWSRVQVVFDAAAAGWAMVDHPSLAVDERETLHVAWVRMPLPGDGQPEGIYYAHSGDSESLRPDSGQAWSEPVQIAEGAYDWPCAVAAPTGQVHLVWGEASGSLSWIHQRSVDGGAGWTRSERVGRFTGVRGPVGLVGNGAGMLHLVGVGQDDAGEPALLHTVWADGRWGDLETLRLTAGARGEPGVAVALRSALGRLDVVFRVEAEGEEGETQVNVHYTGRPVPVVETIPTPVSTPRPTTIPTPRPTPTATPIPQLEVNTVAPSPVPSSVSLGPMTLPFASLGGLLLSVLIVVTAGILALRSPWTRRR
jgi:hypothetical protein